MICATTAVIPTTPRASANTAKAGAAAAHAWARPVTAIVIVISRRLRQVSERDQQRQPDHVAGLARRDQRPGGAVRDRECVTDGVKQRLGVVQVCHRGPAHEREEHNQPAVDPGPKLCGVSLLWRIGHQIELSGGFPDHRAVALSSM